MTNYKEILRLHSLGDQQHPHCGKLRLCAQHSHSGPSAVRRMEQDQEL